MEQLIEPTNWKVIRQTMDEILFNINSIEDCLQKSAIKMANFVFNNSHQIATGEMELPVSVGWEFNVRGSRYQVVMNIREAEDELDK